jgi:hypothetical protein
MFTSVVASYAKAWDTTLVTTDVAQRRLVPGSLSYATAAHRNLSLRLSAAP